MYLEMYSQLSLFVCIKNSQWQLY